MAEKTRDTGIDVMRGIAVFTMVSANLAGSVLAEPHPLWLRFFGTFAAPFFVMLSGMMVASGASGKGYGLTHYLVRGALVMAMGVLIDVIIIWRIAPFMTVDVLYLIGLSLPIAYLFGKLPLSLKVVVILAIIGVTPYLVSMLGYADYPSEIGILGGEGVEGEHNTSVLSHWLVDGWFPIFPWLAVALFGTLLAELRQARKSFADPQIVLGAFVLFFAGAALWAAYPGALMTRDGYSEMFYEATPGFIVTSLGLAVLIFAAVDINPKVASLAPFAVFGEAALAMYCLHLVFIDHVIVPLISADDLTTYVGEYAALLAVLQVIGWGIRRLKQSWKTRPFIVRFLIGG
jgi:uncharacterized membrane protein